MPIARDLARSTLATLALLTTANVAATELAARLQISRPIDGDTCTAALFIDGQPAGSLLAGEQRQFTLPPGEVSLMVNRLGSGLCSSGEQRISAQSVLLAPGEARHYQIEKSASGYFLSPAPPSSALP